MGFGVSGTSDSDSDSYLLVASEEIGICFQEKKYLANIVLLRVNTHEI